MTNKNTLILGNVLLTVVVIVVIVWMIASTCHAESVRPCDTTYTVYGGSFNVVTGVNTEWIDTVVTCDSIGHLTREVARLTKTLDSLVKAMRPKASVYKWPDSIYMYVPKLIDVPNPFDSAVIPVPRPKPVDSLWIGVDEKDFVTVWKNGLGHEAMVEVDTGYVQAIRRCWEEQTSAGLFQKCGWGYWKRITAIGSTPQHQPHVDSLRLLIEWLKYCRVKMYWRDSIPIEILDTTGNGPYDGLVPALPAELRGRE